MGTYAWQRIRIIREKPIIVKDFLLEDTFLRKMPNVFLAPKA